MSEVNPTIALQATEAASQEDKLGIQVGEPVGHARPPRVYSSIHEFSNAGVAGVVTEIMESGGIVEAQEFSEPGFVDEQLADKAAEYVQDYLNARELDDGAILFMHGSEEMAESVLEHLNLPDNIDVKINEGDPEYIPDPTS